MFWKSLYTFATATVGTGVTVEAPHEKSLMTSALVAVMVAVSLICGCAMLTTEYLVVQFAPSDEIDHAGQCPLGDVSDGLQPSDIEVLIEGECHGSRVGDIISLTAGSFEISVDVVGAQTQVVDLELTTPENPNKIIIQIAPGG